MSELTMPSKQKDDGVHGAGYNQGIDDCMPFIEQLQRQNDELVAKLARVVRGLEHIAEYWNQDRNDQAMFDALMHIEDEVHLLIDETNHQSPQHIEAAAVDKLKFPTMFRKMWSGGEVQEWLKQQAELLRQQSTNGSDGE